MIILRAVLGLIALAALTAADAPPVKVENPIIHKKYATATITTSTDDTLLNVYSRVMAMPHLSKRKRMGIVSSIPFKAGVPRTLNRYGYHIMLMTLTTAPTADMILVFDKAGAVKVTFKVVS